MASALYAEAGARAAARMVDVNLATTGNDPRRAEAAAAAERAGAAAERAQGLES